MVFALPAASAPPMRVTAISPSDGSPRLASSIVGSVVTRSSSMILGLVSATRDLAISPIERRDNTACDESRPLAAARIAAASGSAFVACVTRRPRSPVPCPPNRRRQVLYPLARPPHRRHFQPRGHHAAYYRS